MNHRDVNAYTPNPVNFNRRVFFSDEQLRGCLRNYDQWGADGTYTCNFCCETIDNPDFVRRAHNVAKKTPQQRRSTQTSYFFLPIWRRDHSPSGAEQVGRTLHFGPQQPVIFHFRVAHGADIPNSGRLRFRVYNLHDLDRVEMALNGQAIPPAAIFDRRKTNIHVAADTRYPGMHIPPHIAYEIDLALCPLLAGDNQLQLTSAKRGSAIGSECMLEAIEVDVGWNGTLQTVGYPLDPP